MSKKTAAVFVGIISNIIFGFSFIFTKDALETLGVSNIVFLAHRFMLASAVMAAIALVRRQRFSFKGRPWYKLVLLGLCQPVIYFLAANYGLLQSTSTFSAVIIALVPVVATMEAMVFLKERPTWIQTVLCLLSVSAVVVMSYLDTNSGNTTVWGVALLVVSSVAAGTFNLISRESREQFTPFERTFAMFVVAAITFTVLALVENRSAPQLMVQPLFKSSYIVDLLYLGGLSSVVGFFGVNYANTYLPVVQATAFSNITTIVSVMAGIFILREPFTWVTIPAALVIMTSVWGIQKFDRRDRHAQ
ncbi:MAG: DMT family transporter [Clostridia bacterium]|nr:DMT family transporter [Clostridia bacterium]